MKNKNELNWATVETCDVSPNVTGYLTFNLREGNIVLKQVRVMLPTDLAAQ